MRNGLGDPVFSVYAGVIVAAGPSSTGNYVVVQNYDGSVSGYVHVTATVQVGDAVWAGTWLGRTDMSGNVQGAHLHYYWIPSGSSQRADPTSILGSFAPGARVLVAYGGYL